MAQVNKIMLGSQGLDVSAQGLGCMTMSAPYQGLPKPEPDMIALIHHAINAGLTLLDTADLYGPFTNKVLIGKALKAGMREKVQLATKCGCSLDGYNVEVRGDPEYVRACCEASLKRLRVDCIYLYYLHWIDTRVPIEVTIGELKKLVEEGKINRVVFVVERDIQEDVVPTCRELGIGIVAYSPLGRGFFTSGPKVAESYADDDFRKGLPRFQLENLEHNNNLLQQVNEMASRKGCSTSQLALAWVHHQVNGVCPIPGTTKVENLNLNIGALSVKLTPEELAELESIASADAIKGDRSGGLVDIPTWQDSKTPPLSSWKAI